MKVQIKDTMSTYLNSYKLSKCAIIGPLFGTRNAMGKTMHITSSLKFPQAAALKLPTNVVDINASEMGRFSPLRARDITGPVINSYYNKKDHNYSKIDVTVQSDPHTNKYDCHGAVNLSSSMQSNVPSPFSGNHTHLSMPGSQWGQGYKYLSDHLHGAHYLNLRNEYRQRNQAVAVGLRFMCSDAGKAPVALTSKDKLKQAVKDYGPTVIIFHISISVMSLGACYLLVSSGFDVVAVMKSLNIGGDAITKVASSNAGTFVIAYAIHKFFAPFRIAVTLTCTPFIVRYLRHIGMLKSSISANGGGK